MLPLENLFEKVSSKLIVCLNYYFYFWHEFNTSGSKSNSISLILSGLPLMGLQLLSDTALFVTFLSWHLIGIIERDSCLAYWQQHMKQTHIHRALKKREREKKIKHTVQCYSSLTYCCFGCSQCVAFNLGLLLTANRLCPWFATGRASNTAFFMCTSCAWAHRQICAMAELDCWC